MNVFSLLISAPDAILYRGDAVSCAVTTSMGQIGLEAKHEPFLAVLAENSEIRYTAPESEAVVLTVTDGLLLFKDNDCTLAIGGVRKPETSDSEQ